MKYQSSSIHCSKVISKVKVSERRTELQSDRMIELQNDRQDKNNMPPDLRSRGHNDCPKYTTVYFRKRLRIMNIFVLNKSIHVPFFKKSKNERI